MSAVEELGDVECPYCQHQSFTDETTSIAPTEDRVKSYCDSCGSLVLNVTRIEY